MIHLSVARARSFVSVLRSRAVGPAAERSLVHSTIGQATVLPFAKSTSLAMRVAYPLCAVAVAACTASSDEVRPPTDQLFFPTGVALTPDESSLAVANANSELRYDSGTLSLLDLALVDTVTNDWLTNQIVPDGCKRDPLSPATLECDEARFIRTEGGVRLGNFATSIATQAFANGAYRFIVPVRGDPSVTWVDGNGPALTCSADGVPFALCDDAHRLTTIQDNDTNGVLIEEPFGVYADSMAGYAVVAHLTTGALTLLDSQGGAPTQIADVVTGLFGADSSGLRGATAVAGRTPGNPNGLIYAVARSEDRVQMLTVGRQAGSPAPFLLPTGYFFLDAVGGTSGGSSDSRGLAFSNNGDRMYVLNRRPPTVQVYDTSLDETGVPKNRGLAATDVCRNASGLTVANVGDGDRAYVSCFADGTINVIDPRGGAMLTRVITVGRGPYALAISPVHRKLYVSNFLEDTIGVIDLAPGSASADRVVLRIGERRQ